MTEDDKKQIGKSIEELKQTVNATDSESRARLAPVVEKIEKGVETPEEEPDLTDTLTETIEDFEVEHPEVTGILNNILHLLSNLGI